MLTYVLLITLCVLLVIFGARFLEHRWPVGPNLPHPEVMADWQAVFVNLLLFWPLGIWLTPISAWIVISLGGGLFRLPVHGLWYGVSLAGYLLVYDFYRYGLHRLEHRVPFLWAMHSFHHSANALTLVTGARHWWLEKVITGMFFPIMPILFTIPADMATVISVVYFLPDACAHLNVRFPMGRFITWVNSPQWHRIHHSIEPHHLNKNFSGGLPLWDILFGTAYVPQRDEYPETGLIPAERVDVIDSIIWPFRHLRQQRIARQTP